VTLGGGKLILTHSLFRYDYLIIHECCRGYDLERQLSMVLSSAPTEEDG